MDENMRIELCIRALKTACRDKKTEGMILRSDRSSQFTSQQYREVLRRHKIV